MEGQFSVEFVAPQFERDVLDFLTNLETERRQARSIWRWAVCALWWGHRPVRVRPYSSDFALDELTCRCGRVTAPAEDVHRYHG